MKYLVTLVSNMNDKIIEGTPFNPTISRQSDFIITQRAFNTEENFTNTSLVR